MRVDGSIASALNEVRSVSGALAGGKAAGDIASVEEFDSAEDYVSSQRRLAMQKAAPAKAVQDMVNDDEKTGKVFDKMVEHAISQHKLKEFTEDALNSGIAEVDPSTGNIVATSGDKWVRGMATLGAGAMERDQRIVVGGIRMNLATSALTGDTAIDANSSETDEMGRKRNTNIKAAFAEKIAKQYADDPNDKQEVLKLTNAILDATDGASFVASKDGAIMGVTSLSVAAMKKAGVSTDKIDDIMEAMVINQNNEDEGIGIGSYVVSSTVGGAGLYGLEKITSSKPQKVTDANGKPVVDTNKPVVNAVGDAEFRDTNGKKVYQDAKTGDFYTQSDDGAIKPHSGEKLTPSYEQKTKSGGGVVSKTAKGILNGVKSGAKKTSEFLTDSFVFGDTGSNTFDNPTNSTNNGSSNNNNHKTDSTVNKHSAEHVNPLNSDAQSITNNAQNGKTSVESASNKVQALGDAVEAVESMKPQDAARN